MKVNGLMNRKWTLAQVDRSKAQYLAAQLNVHPVVGHLLAGRGVDTVEQGQMFLDRRLTKLHDPLLHPGIPEAAKLLCEAVKAGKKICIYGDYDVDGMCATAILLECLKIGGATPRFYVPDRLEEGYGVNGDALRSLKRDGVDVVVTVDCGITALAEAEIAKAEGITYIVTDHHEMVATLPNADAIVHPRLAGSQYPFGQLCGAGVAFKLAWELARQLTGDSKVSPAFRKFLTDATSLAAVGTICDVVPMTDENRILVYYGLQSLKKSPPLGLAKMMMLGKLGEKARLEASDVAFYLGPRLNACGRLGQARLGVELLVTRDEKRAAELARYLEEENLARQTLERRLFGEAKELAQALYPPDGDDTAMIVASESFHPGVMGIVASRLVERYHRPCIMMNLGKEYASGSGRSVPGFHLQQALAECGDILERSGGHAMAAGMKVRLDRLEEFRTRFHEISKRLLAGRDREGEILVDMEIPLDVLSFKLIESLEILEPFGPTNQPPIFMASNLEVVGEPKKVGGGERHLMFKVRQANRVYKAIAFGMAERTAELTGAGARCSLVFRPNINEFNGFRSVDLEVKDMRAAERSQVVAERAILQPALAAG